MRLHVYEWGDADAPPLVCLHGIAAHGRRFRRLAEEHWTPQFRVIAPDLRGHGRSEYDPPWSIATHVADVLETLDELGVGRATWVGHSFGGRLLLEIAAAYTDRVERAVLLDPAIQILPHVGFDFANEERKDHSFASIEEAIDARLATGAPTPRDFLEDEMHEFLVPSPDGRLRFQYFPPAVIAAYGDMCSAPPPPETLRAPALLVYAGDFGLVREEQLDEYAGALDGRLTLRAVPGGHMVYWDAYQETAAAIRDFLGF